MRRLSITAAIALCASCGGQSSVDPCSLRINLSEVGNIQVNRTAFIDADVTVRSGSCPSTEKALSWQSSKIGIAEITVKNDSSATILGKSPGSVTIVAWATRRPTVRDSISVTVTAPSEQ